MLAELDKQLEPITMRGRVAKLIRNAILTGKIQPGERIVEYLLSKRLGVGTSSVREALFELEREGFVRRVANKGAHVIKLSAADIVHIYRVRKELEVLAVDLLLERGGEIDLQVLQEPLDAMREAALAMELARFYESDLSFHKALWALSQNPYLVIGLEQIVVPLFAFSIMRNSHASKEELIKSVEQHERIANAIKTRNIAHARQVIQEIISVFSEQDSRDLQSEPDAD
jgi:DNA-binding GntR family transcriptional regulator